MVIVIFFFGYMFYKNYVLISTGEMDKIIKRSRKNKRNNERWEVDEI